MLIIRNLSFSFGEKIIFNKLNLTMGEENPVTILGPSGCGKTTLLRLIAGLLQPGEGEVILPAEDTDACGPAFVFQEPRLLPWKTALENVMLPVREKAGEAARERAACFLRLVSLEDKLNAYPAQLSGGQRQRVNMARAFTAPGNIILMDEPFQSLDIPLRRQLMDVFPRILARSGRGEAPRLLIAVTHDPREAACLGRRVIILGRPGEGIVFDEKCNYTAEDAAYGSEAQLRMEKRLLERMSVL
jgi:NitT/TauT family transport system ATP-binding protein